MSFGTVAILGPGLIGGSLALAITERKLADKLVIWARRKESLQALEKHFPDALLTNEQKPAVKSADLVILCVPIESLGEHAGIIADALKANAIVTDVGSVKGSVVRELTGKLAGKARWVGSHPMAGSEKAGFAAARADLFQGATVVVTPTGETDAAALATVTAFWQACGGNVKTLSPTEHDRLVAQVSHLPHLLASVLVEQTETAALALAGGGFRDSTRIAGGPPDLWSEILAANATEIAPALRSLIARLEIVADDLAALPEPSAASRLRKLLEDAQNRRRQL
jgi:prephenate dehydrogenase